jgi:two-component system, LytTR family, response regulator
MTIRTLVVDDEEWARRRLIAFLRPLADVSVVGECARGVDAVEAIRDLAPDLVFLDVQMPDFDGFEVLQSIGPELMPLVVFATAYDEYAVRAFEAHALDYLLKPFDQDRLTLSVARAREELERPRAAAQRLEALAQSLPRDRRYLRRLVIKAGGRVLFLRATDVDWFGAAANYVALHSGRQEYLIRDTVAALESKLDPDQFVRIHRSTIVNLDRVREVSACLRGDQTVTLSNGASLPVGRAYRRRLQRFLNNVLD